MKLTKLSLEITDSNEWTPEFQEKPLIERWQGWFEEVFNDEVQSVKVVSVTEADVPDFEEEDAEYTIVDEDEEG